MEATARPTTGVAQRGINYDVGTNYQADELSRPVWNRSIIERDLRAIHDDLHCNAVILYGIEVDRMVEAAEFALSLGLRVWLQPRLINSTRDEVIVLLTEVAKAAEGLRRRHPDVGLNVGCELTLFSSGMLPGRDHTRRAFTLGWLWWLLLPWANRRLRQFLKRALVVARHHFEGQITYASGSWETVPWADFDAVGVNFYMDASNRSRYARGVARLHRFGKPVIITEFGCTTHEGADARGAEGDDIADWEKPEPEIKAGHVRDEDVQADYIAKLFEIYTDNGVEGAFVFEFIETMYPYSPDPRYDLDMACFGVVKVYPHDGRGGGTEHWEPKAAFHRLGALYAAQEGSSGDTALTAAPPATATRAGPESTPARAVAQKPLSARLWNSLGTILLTLGVGYGIVELDNLLYGFLIGFGAVAVLSAVHQTVTWYRGRERGR